MKSKTVLILLGVFNLIHGLSHILQVIQSFLLASYSFKEHNHSGITKTLESPYMGVVWVIVGLLTIIIGIRDFKHHQHHKD